ncbi:MAG: ABC transporter ATP-binding protein [Candidatus Woesearchaeota archaeon]
MDAVTIKNLTKKYELTTALDNVSFNIKKGEIFGFLGPNGAGKTTTINCITQLANPTSGKIKINGFDTNKDYLEAKKQVGLSPQDLQMDVYFSILEILVYQAGYFGIPSKKAKQRALELLKEFGLEHKKNSKIRELSGGMKRKISIIKAIMHNPKILILDEPTAGLDVDSRIDLWKFVKKLNKKGMTIILTTHYIEEAEKLSDKIAIINKGKIAKLEKTKKIIDDFSINVIEVEVENKDVELKGFEYEKKGRKIIIKTSKKNQSKTLDKVLLELKKKKKIINFSINQDSLENIFRRIVNEK